MICVLRSLMLLAWLVAPAAAADAGRERSYTSPKGNFTLLAPKPSNWAGLPFVITPLDDLGDPKYDRVMFHVDDFGEYLVAGVRAMPPQSVALMDQDAHRTVLRNLSQGSLMGWRRDLETLPPHVEETFGSSGYGETIMRIYRARKGSILARAQGRQPTREDAFDTHIASIVARQGRLVVFVLAQNDSSPDDAGRLVAKATEVFNALRISADVR